MEERYGREGRIWAVDRGMIDAANLKWPQERGSHYIVGTPKGELERFEQRIEKGLQAIVQSCERQRCDLGVVERRIGRLLGKNTRAAWLFSVQVKRDQSGHVVATWSRKASALESAKR